MTWCSLCLGNLENSSDNCKDFSPSNMHYSTKCYNNKLYKTSCNHSFHKCCMYSYVWYCTWADCEDEIGNIKCPLCNTSVDIKIEN